MYFQYETMNMNDARDFYERADLLPWFHDFILRLS